MLTKKEKIYGSIGIILLLLLLFRKKLSPMVSSRLIDPSSGIPIGAEGIRTSSLVIGEVILPPGIPNDISSSAFQYAAQKGEVSLCPLGYSPIIDPQTNAAYCIVSGQDTVNPSTA